PNYAEILRDQWSPDVPPEVRAAERSSENYGRLVDTEPPIATSLPECIALALHNNTDLQIQRLSPISAAAGGRSARAQFDPVAYGDVTRNRTVKPVSSVPSSISGQIFATRDYFLDNNFYFDAGIRKLLRTGAQLSLDWQNARHVGVPSLANLF